MILSSFSHGSGGGDICLLNCDRIHQSLPGLTAAGPDWRQTQITSHQHRKKATFTTFQLSYGVMSYTVISHFVLRLKFSTTKFVCLFEVGKEGLFLDEPHAVFACCHPRAKSPIMDNPANPPHFLCCIPLVMLML